MSKAEQEQGIAAYGAYTEALNKAGVTEGLQPPAANFDATTVRLANGKPQVLDGPYVDSKEQIGGYYLIEAADISTPPSRGGSLPGAIHGVVECVQSGA